MIGDIIINIGATKPEINDMMPIGKELLEQRPDWQVGGGLIEWRIREDG